MALDCRRQHTPCRLRQEGAIFTDDYASERSRCYPDLCAPARVRESIFRVIRTALPRVSFLGTPSPSTQYVGNGVNVAPTRERIGTLETLELGHTAGTFRTQQRQRGNKDCDSQPNARGLVTFPGSQVIPLLLVCSAVRLICIEHLCALPELQLAGSHPCRRNRQRSCHPVGCSHLSMWHLSAIATSAWPGPILPSHLRLVDRKVA